MQLQTWDHWRGKGKHTGLNPLELVIMVRMKHHAIENVGRYQLVLNKAYGIANIILNISVFNALSIGTGLVAAVWLVVKREALRDIIFAEALSVPDVILQNLRNRWGVTPMYMGNVFCRYEVRLVMKRCYAHITRMRIAFDVVHIWYWSILICQSDVSYPTIRSSFLSYRWEKWDHNINKVTNISGPCENTTTCLFEQKDGTNFDFTLSNVEQYKSITFSGKSLGGTIKAEGKISITPIDNFSTRIEYSFELSGAIGCEYWLSLFSSSKTNPSTQTFSMYCL